MTDSDPTRSTPPGEEPAPRPQPEPDAAQPAADPGYLTETGQAAAEDGSVRGLVIASDRDAESLERARRNTAATVFHRM